MDHVLRIARLGCFSHLHGFFSLKHAWFWTVLHKFSFHATTSPCSLLFVRAKFGQVSALRTGYAIFLSFFCNHFVPSCPHLTMVPGSPYCISCTFPFTAAFSLLSPPFRSGFFPTLPGTFRSAPPGCNNAIFSFHGFRLPAPFIVLLFAIFFLTLFIHIT